MAEAEADADADAEALSPDTVGTAHTDWMVARAVAMQRAMAEDEAEAVQLAADAELEEAADCEALRVVVDAEALVPLALVDALAEVVPDAK